MTMITQRGTIRVNHPVREDFANVTTHNDGHERYFGSKGSAIHDYESVLDGYGLCFDRDNLIDLPGDVGRITIPIHIDEYVWGDSPGQSDCVGQALIVYLRMPSGRYWFTGYIIQ